MKSDKCKQRLLEPGRSLEILRFVHGYNERYGVSPAMREIANGTEEILSTSVVSYYLVQFRKYGLVEQKSKARKFISRAPIVLTEEALNALGYKTKTCKHCGSKRVVAIALKDPPKGDNQ